MPKNAKKKDNANDETDYNIVNENDTPASPKSPNKAKTEAQKNREDKEYLKNLKAEKEEGPIDRIIERFMSFMIIGMFISFNNAPKKDADKKEGDSPKKPPTSPKKSKKNEVGFASKSADFMAKNPGKFMFYSIAAVLIAVVYYGKADFDLRGGDANEQNLYDVMELPRGTEGPDVRKKYKSLSLQWHPDKNPGCKHCAEKFDKITKAFNVLSDPEAKKQYDAVGSIASSLKSDKSVEITSVADFESKVLRSNVVWIIQAYDAKDDQCQRFGPAWEALADQYKRFMRFGRVDVRAHPEVVEMLPHRVKYPPFVWRYARGEEPKEWKMPTNVELVKFQNNSEGLSLMYLYSLGFKNFIKANGFPNVINNLDDQSQVSRFWSNTHRARILIGTMKQFMVNGTDSKEWFPAIREAFIWGGFINFGATEKKLAVDALKKDFDIELPVADPRAMVRTSGPYTVAYAPSGATKDSIQVRNCTDVKKIPGLISELVLGGIADDAPPLSVTSSKHLCGGGIAGRKMCLVLVDMPDSEVDKIIKDLRTSEADYTAEVIESKKSQGGEDAQEALEAFKIQAVRAFTSTSRFPGGPMGAPETFYTAWDHVKRSKAFLMEMSTDRVAAVKPTSIANLYQQVGYEDLKLEELPDGVTLQKTLADYEVQLKREFIRLISEPVGAGICWLVLALVCSVGPELTKEQFAASNGVILLVAVVVWPLAFRRALAQVVGGY